MELHFHHARPLAACFPSEVRQLRLAEVHALGYEDCEAEWFDPAYRWLEEKLGFWPLFISVGEDIEAWRATGYLNQFNYPDYIGEPQAMFSWGDLEVEFTDLSWWHVVLNAVNHQQGTLDEIGAFAERVIFKRSWPRAKWLRQEGGLVQAHCEVLDLASADRVLVPTLEAANLLVQRGFSAEKVTRLSFARGSDVNTGNMALQGEVA